MKTIDDLIAAVRKTPVGGQIAITYYEGSSKKTVNVTVQEEPKNLGEATPGNTG